MQRTLCSVQSRSLSVNITDVTQSSLQRLVSDGLVTRKQQADAVTRLDVTRLGKAVYKGVVKFFLLCVQHVSGLMVSVITVCRSAR